MIAPTKCSRCGYPTRGLPTSICPECGADTRVVGTKRLWQLRHVLVAIACGVYVVGALALTELLRWLLAGAVVAGETHERAVVLLDQPHSGLYREVKMEFNVSSRCWPGRTVPENRWSTVRVRFYDAQENPVIDRVIDMSGGFPDGHRGDGELGERMIAEACRGVLNLEDPRFQAELNAVLGIVTSANVGLSGLRNPRPIAAPGDIRTPWSRSRWSSVSEVTPAFDVSSFGDARVCYSIRFEPIGYVWSSYYLCMFVLWCCAGVVAGRWWVRRVADLRST